METRNFCIIAHIDHGKSTLADRFLEVTNQIKKEKMQAQYLDSMDLEREKGITIKMHPVRLNYQLLTTNYQLNLIDTPGHIDFSYEISRALYCCESAVLLVDAVQGIQAQTIFNLNTAQQQGLVIIPVLNKIDAASKEQVEIAKQELAQLLAVAKEDILEVSAKTGLNVEKVLEAICLKTPKPLSDIPQSHLKALIFDSKYDAFSGVIAYIRVFQGTLKTNQDLVFLQNNEKAKAKEVGYFMPDLQKSDVLHSGEIGYVKTGVKEPGKVKIGDTITNLGVSDKPLPGYKEPNPVLFLSLYPQNPDDFEILHDALNKLKLNDPSFVFQVESQMALGRGFRAGFLGALHAEITARRIQQEFGLSLVLTPPQVIFKVITTKNEELFISSANQWPEIARIKEKLEPQCTLEIVTPEKYFNDIFRLFNLFDIELKETKPLGNQKFLLVSNAPLREIITGAFYDKLKAVSSGYASFSFKPTGFKQSDLVKMDILIAQKQEPAFAKILPKDKAFKEGKSFLQKLADILPKQQFTVALQAVIGGKIIARETISAKRKDVTGHLYGGDVTRKRKLLDIQKKGKKELKDRGTIHIPPEVFLQALKS